MTHSDREFILEGVNNGFRITNIDDHGMTSRQANHPSATAAANRDAVEAQIITEINNGRYIICSNPPNIISALAAIPKPDSSDIRLIHDASRPHGRSINDFAKGESYACSTVQAAASMLGHGDYMGKIDLSSAYRSVPLHPADYPRAGLAWHFKGNKNEVYMYDTRLMFGARLSACIFNTLTRAVVDIMIGRGYERNFLVYCDDFFITDPCKRTCQKLMNELMSVLRDLGFAINYKKVIGPSTNLTFLGVVIDTEAYTLSLPVEKLNSLISELAIINSKRSITHRALQSICGKLNWACQVIYGGRIYMRRLLDAMCALRRPHHRVRISGEMKKDIQWWVRIAKVFNGTAPILDPRPTTPISTDACLVGGGGYYRGEWYYVPFREWPGVMNLSINYKEVLAVLPACHIFGPTWYGRRVALHMDNISATHIIRRGTSRDPTVQHYLREIHALSIQYNFRLVPIYYPGKHNTIADAASRLETEHGWQRLQAALNSACRDPMTPHPADLAMTGTSDDGRPTAGRTGAGVPDTGLCSEYVPSIQYAQEALYSFLCEDGSGTGTRYNPANLPIRGISSGNGAISDNSAIHKHCADSTRGVGRGKPIRGELPIDINVARHQESEGRFHDPQAAGLPININAHMSCAPPGNADGGGCMGGGPDYVLRPTAAVQCHSNDAAIFQPRPPLTAAGCNVQANRSRTLNSLVQNEPVPVQDTYHPTSAHQGAPTMPDASYFPRFPLIAKRPTRRPGFHRTGGGRTASPHDGGILLASYTRRAGQHRGGSARIREPLLPKGGLVFPV